MAFAGGGWHGELAAHLESESVMGEVVRLTDPSAAEETLHWGRNYLYSVTLVTASGDVEVVVKQTRNLGRVAQLERRLRGSKATRSWVVAKELVRLGINTPEPLMLVESDTPDGPSLFVARRLRGVAEVRHFFRRLNGEPGAEAFPEVDASEFLEHLGRFARHIHDQGIWYRDLSLGNVLAQPVEGAAMPDLWVVDFNRSRVGRRLGVVRRSRDICRFPILTREDRESFLKGYWGTVPKRYSPRWWLYTASVRGYLLKHSIKRFFRRKKRGSARSSGAKHHAHIPAAADGAGARDKTVWDHLSDQPHQHAGWLAKAGIRLSDSASHLREAATVVAALPGIRGRYRSIRRSLYSKPTPFSGIGLCLRPWPDDVEAHLEMVEDLGVKRLLLRLHPWADRHDNEETLARELIARGCELSFALPQNRDLVRDPEAWRRAVEDLATRFTPYGRHFQVGQAVNRSKWGIWKREEYVRLYLNAAEILRRHGDVEVLGPSVIDFEYPVTAALLNRRTPGLHFDVVTSLLYVDRRGAPENPQLGFDTVGKVALLKAIAETGRNSNGRCWITEVNWPLWEGPHSPAGRTVSVDEGSHADFLVRYYLLALGTGLVERVYWWRLIARGYGLVAPSSDGGLRKRPAYHAFKTMHSLLEGSTFTGPCETEDGVYLYRFTRGDEEICVGWSNVGVRTLELPRAAEAAIDRDGTAQGPPSGTEAEVTGSPKYFFLAK